MEIANGATGRAQGSEEPHKTTEPQNVEELQGATGGEATRHPQVDEEPQREKESQGAKKLHKPPSEK